MVQEIIYLAKTQNGRQLRLNDALYAERIAQRRNEAGDITVIEENRTQIQLLSARNALARTQMALASALAKLSSMTCTPLTEDVSITAMPLPGTASAGTGFGKSLRGGCLPDRRQGFATGRPDATPAGHFAGPAQIQRRVQTFPFGRLNFNGLIVGMSIPIFESRHTVKLARRPADRGRNLVRIATRGPDHANPGGLLASAKFGRHACFLRRKPRPERQSRRVEKSPRSRTDRHIGIFHRTGLRVPEYGRMDRSDLQLQLAGHRTG